MGRYALGFGALVCVIGPLGMGAVALRSTLLPDWQGAVARLAECVVGLALLVAICQALGTVGLFRFAPIVAASLLVGAGLWLWVHRIRRVAPAEHGVDRRARLLNVLCLALALLAAGLVMAEWAGKTLRAYDHGMLGLDSLWFHMPWAAWYAQSGQVAALHFMDVQYLSAFYPATGEVLHGLGIVLMGNDLLSPGFNLVFLGLLLLAAWCMGSPRGLGALTVTGAALSMAASALFNSQPGSADTDTLGAFFFIAAVALWLNSAPAPRAGSGVSRATRHSTEDSRTALALAGISAGLASAVRLNLILPVVALSFAVIAGGWSGRRRAVAGVWLAAVALSGGFWYLRNLLEVGNPLPWFGHGLLPTPHPPLMQQSELTVWHYLTNGTVWTRAFVPLLRANLGPWWVVIVAVAIGGAMLCVAVGPERTVRMIGLVTLASFLGYLLTPGTAAGSPGHPIGFGFNLRYSLPALTLGLASAALARPLSGTRMRWVTFAVLATTLGVTLVAGHHWVGGYVAGAVIATGFLLVVGVALGAGAPRALRSARPVRRLIAIAVGAVLLAAAGFGGYAAQRNYLRGRYASVPHLVPVNMLWRWARGVHHARIGIGGTAAVEFHYPIWGVDDSNHVEYVAHHGPNGSFTPIRTCRKWRQALNAGRYQYVVTSKSVNAVTRILSYSPENDWTIGDPGAHLLTPLSPEIWIQVFEIVRPLDPAGCDRPRT